MERWIAVIVGIIAVVAGALWFWLRGSPPQPPELAARLFVVEIRDSYFDPPGLTIKPGDRVVWVLKEHAHGDGHTATAYHPSQDRPLRIPLGAAPWNSKLMTQIGQTYPQIFSVPGVYDYFCTLHEQQGMVGRLIVGDLFSAQPAAAGLPAAALSAMPTMDELQGAVGEAFNAIALINGLVYLARQGTMLAALAQVRALQELVQQGALAEALQQRKLKEPWKNRLAALETLLKRGAPLSALEPTAAQAKTLLDAIVQGGP